MTTVPGFARSLWKDAGTGSLGFAAASGRQTVDLAIVGGGLLGLSTALHARRLGLSVAVLEAGQIGSGAAGLNGGQVIPGLKHDPQELEQLFGEERGNRLLDFVGSTADDLFGLIAQERLEVPFVRNGWIQAAHTRSARDAAARKVSQWRQRGADVALLDAPEIAALTGSTTYLGGWIDRRAGVVQPYQLALSLAERARMRGAQIFEQSKVTDIEQKAGLWSARTGTGAEILAKTLLVATNAYSDDLVPGLRQSLVTLNSFQVATSVLPPDVSKAILPQGQAVSDSRRILVYYRKSPDGRLVIGGRGRMVPQSPFDWAHLVHAMERLYPQLTDMRIERRWFGKVAVTPDYLPRLHEPAPGLLTFVGCQGRGVGLMVAMGRKIAETAQSGDRSGLPFPITPIRPIPLHGLRNIAIAARIGWYRLLDRYER